MPDECIGGSYVSGRSRVSLIIFTVSIYFLVSKYLDLEQAILRDDNHCILTGSNIIEVAQIYPDYLYRKSIQRQEVDLWMILKYFFPSTRVDTWKDVANTKYHTPANLFCLSPVARALWNTGAFALKPISRNNNNTTLIVQFFWQVESLEPPTLCKRSLFAHPSSIQHLTGPPDSQLYHINSPGQYIKSGDVFTLSTEDPEKMPLPSFELLELQWCVHRILAMAGPTYEEGEEEGEEEY
ncbi:hypothetical protein B7463_g12461, partial [Scytalidium lignicola]